MTYFVYILECNDQTFYVGLTNNIEKRVHAHNSLKAGARYTKTRRPVKLLYSEACDSISLAMKRERALKKFTREQKKKLILSLTK